MKQVIAIDWDHTAWNTLENKPYPEAWDVLAQISINGYLSMILSCNDPRWIREMCDKHRLLPDMIWGEEPLNEGDCPKPVYAAFIDDRNVAHRGDWKASLEEAFRLVEERPIKNYKGPKYLGNARR